jgi:hypothetical protein
MWCRLDWTSGGQAFPGGDCHAPIRSRRRSRATVDDTTDDGQVGGHRLTNRPRVSPPSARDPTRPARHHQRQSLPARKHPASRPSHQATARPKEHWQEQQTTTSGSVWARSAGRDDIAFHVAEVAQLRVRGRLIGHRKVLPFGFTPPAFRAARGTLGQKSDCDTSHKRHGCAFFVADPASGVLGLEG